MAATYEPIASTTLGSDTASYTFSSIPGTFTDLVLVVSAQGTSTAQNLLARLNGDTASNYSNTIIYGTGATAASARASNQTYLRPGTIPASTDSPGIESMHIMSYANTNLHKTCLQSTAGPGLDVIRRVALWRSTAAITSIEIYPENNSLKAGSTLSLYGIKAA